MEITKQLLNHVTFTSHDEVDSYCKPLKNLGIIYLDYVRIYFDHSRLHLSNNHSWAITLFEKYYAPTWLYFERTSSNKIGFNLSDINLWNKHPKQEVVNQLIQQFGVLNGLAISSYQKDYLEYFYLGPEQGNAKSKQLYIDKIFLLKKFIFFFREKAQKLINYAEGHKFKNHTIESGEETMIVSSNDDPHLFNMNINKYYLGGCYENAYLTKKEFECLQWLVKGKSFEEISVLTLTSKRTVETHINNIKKKFKCNKIAELIYKALECGVII